MKHGHGQRAVSSLVIPSTTSNAHYEVQREMLGSRGSLRLLAQAMETTFPTLTTLTTTRMTTLTRCWRSQLYQWYGCTCKERIFQAGSAHKSYYARTRHDRAAPRRAGTREAPRRVAATRSVGFAFVLPIVFFFGAETLCFLLHRICSMLVKPSGIVGASLLCEQSARA